MNNINNTMEVIDSRDIIERIQELKEIMEMVLLSGNNNLSDWLSNTTDGKEYRKLTSLQEQCEDCVDDWEYGVALIHEDYFEQYMDEMIEDCYSLPKDLPFWMKVTYDYDALKMDYTEVCFGGTTYFVRYL